MFKTTKIILLLAAFTLAIGCKESVEGSADSSLATGAPELSMDTNTALNTGAVATFNNQQDQDNDDLLFMWEEEKMARDVYTKMFEKYGAAIFSNIKQSESKHMDAVKKLLDQRKIATPIDGTQIGNFKNVQIAQMYAELMAEGNVSLNDAYQVGLKIEMVDIEDLAKRISNTKDPAIINVYMNLLKGSENHKASFESKL
ncbi:MAG: DUF2202 domain-containing protein [Alphaproteobacteria bacterium]|nr:MAG: DUF2202 domain-containing protein [Alphaproteobacteria bacterium]